MNKNLRIYIPIAVMLAMICGLAVAGRAHIADIDGGHRTQKTNSKDFKITSPQGHQAIKAKIEDSTPERFTINVKTMANLGVNEEASTFAVYTKPRMPHECGDFRNLEISYKKPDKYTRVFNLSSYPDVLKAIEKEGCVVMRNIPPK